MRKLIFLVQLMLVIQKTQEVHFLIQNTLDRILKLKKLMIGITLEKIHFLT